MCDVYLLFQNCENTRRSWMARPARANTRPRDANAVTIHISHLLSNAGYEQQRSFRRALGFPNVFPRLQCYRFRRHTYALSENFAKMIGRSRMSRPAAKAINNIKFIVISLIGNWFSTMISIGFARVNVFLIQRMRKFACLSRP